MWIIPNQSGQRHPEHLELSSSVFMVLSLAALYKCNLGMIEVFGISLVPETSELVVSPQKRLKLASVHESTRRELFNFTSREQALPSSRFRAYERKHSPCRMTAS